MKVSKKKQQMNLVMYKCNLLLELSSKNPYPTYRNTVKMIALDMIKDLRRT